MKKTSTHSIETFDIGHVLVHVDFPQFYENLSVLTGYNVDHVRELCQASPPIYQDFEIGRIDEHVFFEKFKSLIPRSSLSFEQFVSLYTGIFSLKTDVWKLAKRLQSDFRTSIISNTDVLHFSRICRDYDFAIFEHPTTSFEAGARKPDAFIYRYALSRMQCRPGNAVFIDDKEENIRGAQKVGMHGILFRNHRQLVSDLHDLGLMSAQGG